MRTVILDRNHPGHAGVQPNEALRRRQAGHLAARLREYNGFGIEQVTVEDDVVTACIGTHSGEQAAARLAQRNVFCEWEGASAVFAVGAHTCFEELDYVQAAASELL